MSSDRFDRRGLGVLATGHLWADFLQGAIPALLPFLIAEHGYSYGAAGALLLAASLGSSIVQPLFGVASDRLLAAVADAASGSRSGVPGSRWSG